LYIYLILAKKKYFHELSFPLLFEEGWPDYYRAGVVGTIPSSVINSTLHGYLPPLWLAVPRHLPSRRGGKIHLEIQKGGS
jgi:hypothetical protein